MENSNRYAEFDGLVQDAESGEPAFTLEAKLILSGRIEYAMERGDLTVGESVSLVSRLGKNFRERYNNDSEIASRGLLDSERE